MPQNGGHLARFWLPPSLFKALLLLHQDDGPAGLCEQEQAEDTPNNAPVCNEPQQLQLRARPDRHGCPLARDPIDAIQIRMQQSGIDRREIAQVLATTNGTVSEFLNRRKRLKIDAVCRLADALNLSDRRLLQSCQLTPHKPGSPVSAQRGNLAA